MPALCGRKVPQSQQRPAEVSRQYCLPVAAVKNYHRFGGLTTTQIYSPTVLETERGKPVSLGKVEVLVLARRVLPKTPEKSLFPCLFQLPEAAHVPASFRPLVSIVTAHISPVTLLPPLLSNPCVVGPSGQPGILKSITSQSLLPCKVIVMDSEGENVDISGPWLSPPQKD